MEVDDDPTGGDANTDAVAAEGALPKSVLGSRP